MKHRHFNNRMVEGFTSQRAAKFVRVENGDIVAYVPLSAFTLDERRARTVLAGAGIFTPGVAWRELCDDVAALHDFPHRLIADRSGWNGDAFFMPDGYVLAADETEHPAVAFEPNPARCKVMGTIEDWTASVAVPLTDQALPMTAVMMAFASPLLELIGRHENFGFELVGKGGTGKTTIQRLAASTCGGSEYLQSFNATLAGLEEEMAASNGLLMTLDEANAFYGDDQRQRRGSKFKTVAFRLAIGKATRRYLGPQPERYYYIFLTSSNESLGSLLGAEARDVSAAASDRFMTLKIAPSRPHGIFEFVPGSYASAEAFAKALELAVAGNHGQPIRTYLHGLVEDVSRDRTAVADRIRANIQLWRERAGVGSGDDGAIGRVGDAFGLLYAAGVEAQRYGVLPEAWRCGQAVRDVYRNFYIGPKPPQPVDEELRAYLQQPGVYDLDARGLRSMGLALWQATPAFLQTNRQGHQEAILPKARVERDLPDLLSRLDSSRAGVRLNPEKGRDTNKRQVRLGHLPDRMLVLILPPGFMTAV